MNFDYPSKARFRCLKCGICCGDTKEKTRHILILGTEAEQIATATKQPLLKFAAQTEGRAPYSYEMKKRTKDGTCVFLKNNSCTIYLLRPLICRFYPFELKTVPSGKYIFLYTDECPGINKGRLLNEGYFKKIFRLARAKYMQNAHLKLG